MITQTAISAKIDSDLLQELDEECRLYGGTRNRRINNAIRLHLETEDKERYRAYHASCGSMVDLDNQYTAEKYILDNMTDYEVFTIDNIRKALRLDRFKTIMRLLRIGIADYQQKYSSYMPQQKEGGNDNENKK